MSIEIKILTSGLEQDYEQLLQESTVSKFNHSLRYRSFLKEILSTSEDRYLCAFEEGQLLAVLPVFIKQGPLGAVVNSLPFYGSHGGIVGVPNLDRRVSKVLLDALNDVCLEVDALTCTVIESPWETDKECYASYAADLFDERIGQITCLPDCDVESNVEERLMPLYHQKTRNMVRKGLKGGFEVGHDDSSSTLNELHSIHDDNIRGLGGVAKPMSVFQAMQRTFKYNDDYRIYTARKDGQIVSALLLFYFKNTVEYYTPATLESYRRQQPSSLLIFRAMRDAVVERAAKYWNWGGTWLSQGGVYQFKSRWGTSDFPYRYHIKKYASLEILQNITKEGSLRDYPGFYVFPFSKLN